MIFLSAYLARQHMVWKHFESNISKCKPSLEFNLKCCTFRFFQFSIQSAFCVNWSNQLLNWKLQASSAFALGNSFTGGCYWVLLQRFNFCAYPLHTPGETHVHYRAVLWPRFLFFSRAADWNPLTLDWSPPLDSCLCSYPARICLASSSKF